MKRALLLVLVVVATDFVTTINFADAAIRRRIAEPGPVAGSNASCNTLKRNSITRQDGVYWIKRWYAAGCDR